MTGWESIDAALSALGLRYGAPTPGQTTTGDHVPNSEHFQGRARDYGTADSDAAAIATALLPYAQGPNAPIDELFFSPLNIFYDKGQPYTPTADERQAHYSHVHVGLAPGVDLAAAIGTGGAGAQLVSTGIGGAVGSFLAPLRKAAFTAVFVAGGVGLLVLGAMRTVKRGEPS
jgi:hypothetical protein